MTAGRCSLTGNTGRYVKCHLIPKSLTKPRSSGSHFVQFGVDESPTRVWDSWYDKSLVTREGEDILEGYDDFAVKELKRLELVWRHIRVPEQLVQLVYESPGMWSFGLRTVTFRDPRKMRLFFLSLLWRAAATKRREFAQIEIGSQELEILTAMVRDGNIDPLDFFPATLLQIVPPGFPHNHAPTALDATVDTGGGREFRHNVFRFFIDGLIVNIHRSKLDVSEISALIVGGDLQQAVQMQLVDDAMQIQHLMNARDESIRRWPSLSYKFVR